MVMRLDMRFDFAVGRIGAYSGWEVSFGISRLREVCLTILFRGKRYVCIEV